MKVCALCAGHIAHNLIFKCRKKQIQNGKFKYTLDHYNSNLKSNILEKLKKFYSFAHDHIAQGEYDMIFSTLQGSVIIISALQ